MMGPMIIREETAADAEAAADVICAAFGRTDEARLVETLRQDGDAEIALVAVDDGQIAGHVMFSRMTAPFPALALGPVSVLPRKQVLGIGGALIGAGLDRARAGGWRGVFVLGDPAYYRRFGFDTALAAGFASPYAGSHFMALALAGPLPVLKGQVDYADAFSDLA